MTGVLRLIDTRTRIERLIWVRRGEIIRRQLEAQRTPPKPKDAA